MARSEKEEIKSPAEMMGALFDKYNALTDPPMSESGSEIFDAVVSAGRGIPAGVWIELTSAPGVGKSTGCLHIAKKYCSRGDRVFYVDVEHGVNESQIEGVGLKKYQFDPQSNPDGLLTILSPTTFEQTDEIFGDLLKIAPKLVILDSITTLAPGKLLDKGVEEIEPGLQARYAANFLMKYKALYREKGITVILINQVRTHIRFRGITTVEPAGGNALKFYCDVRLMLEQSKALTKTKENMSGKEQVQYGSQCKLFSIKNRFAQPFTSLNLYILFGKGISNILSYIEFLQLHGKITLGASGVYTIKLDEGMEPVKKRGLPAMERWVKENLKEVKEFVKANGGFKLESEEKED